MTRLRVGPVPRGAERHALVARNPEGRVDGVGERRCWRPSRAARPEDKTSSATESRAMPERTSARRGSGRVCARRQGTATAHATAQCAASTASAAAKQRSWRPLSFALSLAFDVRAGREHRLLPMTSARNLCSHTGGSFGPLWLGRKGFLWRCGLVLIAAGGRHETTVEVSTASKTVQMLTHKLPQDPPSFPSPETRDRPVLLRNKGAAGGVLRLDGSTERYTIRMTTAGASMHCAPPVQLVTSAVALARPLLTPLPQCLPKPPSVDGRRASWMFRGL